MHRQTRYLSIKLAIISGASAAALFAMPASAQTVCVPGVGGLNCSPTNNGDAIDLPGQTDPITVDLPEGFETTETILVDSTGPVTLDGDAIVNTVGDDQPALDLTSGADIFAQVGTLTTDGTNSAGAVLQAVDNVVFVVDESITALGDTSEGINVSAGSADITVGEVRTAGVESNGVEIVTVSGPGTLDAELIETLSDGSTAALVESSGDIGVNVGVLRTEGDQALGLDLQSDPAACAVLGAGSCDINAEAQNITTDGFGSTGALIAAAGNTDLAVDVLETNGDQAAGLDLSADPTACVALGVGACDTAFTVENLATNGANAPGAIVRAAGDIDGNIGVLTTNGDDSVGLDLASDPEACAILGAGGCATAFSVGQLTTNGDGATGALVRAAGPTSANIGVLETFGDDASGVDIAADPETCVLLGLGQCDTALTADRISTEGDGSAGALIASPGDVDADFGTVETLGADAPAVAVTGDPEACVLLGVGACDTNLTADSITTQGPNSGGVLVNSPGQIVADIGLVQTDGDNSPAVTLTPDAGACALLGEGSCGVVTNIGEVDTSGDNSDGVNVATGEGDQTIVTGPVTANGEDSNGIVADASGCADVSITATGPVSAPNGVGINAASGCSVSVTTLDGAPVSGGDAGILVTSGSGAAITIGDDLSSPGGPALDVNGAAAVVTITPTGTIQGAIDLTDNADLLTNNGQVIADQSSDFGAGADLFVNNGAIVATAGPVSFTGLETLSNAGIIDMRDGATDDVLTMPGDYSGGGDATLGVDVGGGTDSDLLVIGGAATGSTLVRAAGLDGQFVDGAILVDAGDGSDPDAFTLPATTVGLTDYTLEFDAAANDYSIFGSPNVNAVGNVVIAQGAREIFYRGNEAVGAQLDSVGTAGGSETPRIGRALWLQGFAMLQSRDTSLDAAPFGRTTSYDLAIEQDWFGLQIGADLWQGSEATLGLTAGFITSQLDVENAPLRLDYNAYNIGVYGRFDTGSVFLKGLVKYERYDIDYQAVQLGLVEETDGEGWGGWLEAGASFGGERSFVDPFVSVEYAQIQIDGFTAAATDFALDEEAGLRGKAGLRAGTRLDDGPNPITVYAGAMAIHEFGGEDTLSVANSGQSLSFVNPRPGTYGRGTLGFTFEGGARVSGFIEGSADFGGGVSGAGARAGLSIRF